MQSSTSLTEMVKEEKLAEDVCRVLCASNEYGYRKVNLYIFGDVLIDTGCSNAKDEVVSILEKKKISAVFLTHWHEDHSGNAYALREMGIPIFASHLTAEILRNPPEIPEYRKLVWGDIKPVQVQPLANDEISVPGGIKVKAIPSPGHSRDHTIYLIDDFLFVGDIIGARKILVALKEENYSQILKTLKEIIPSIDFSYALGGHVIMTKKETLDFLSELSEIAEKARALKNQGVVMGEIFENIIKLSPEDERKIEMMEKFSGGEWSRENFIKTILEE